MQRRDIESLLQIPGATSATELAHLYKLASQAKSGCIVEIGGYRGRSTAALAWGSKDGANAAVFCIEPHETFTGVLGGQFGPRDRVAFFQNLLHHGAVEQVRLVNLSSEVVAPGWTRPVALLWVDGDHRFEAVQRDIDCWLPHLAADALIVLDDAEVEGPKRVIEGLVASGWTLVDRVGKTASLTRGASGKPSSSLNSSLKL